MNIDKLNELGGYLAETGKFEAAAAAFKRATRLDPSRRDLHANLADVLRRLWRFEESQDEITKALADGPFEKALFIAGCLALDRGESDKALEYFTPRICFTPYGRFVRSQALLHASQWKEGFEELEARLDMLAPNHPPIPIWKGESLKGKRLALHHEQGYGDSVCYARFAAMLPPENVLIGVPAPLVGLFHRQMEAQVVNTNEPLSGVDYYLPMMSLPRVLGLDHVDGAPYFLSAQTKFDIPRAPDTRIKVGVVWAAKAGQPSTDVAVNLHGQQKSLPFEQLLPLAAIPGIQLYSLQTGAAQNDIAEWGAQHLVFDLGAKMQGFDDLASFMQEMDLIVSVDTAPLHLAGAMGKPTLGLLSCRGGWPFPGLGKRTQWYNSVTLMRQKRPHDWSTVIEEVADHLKEMLCAS